MTSHEALIAAGVTLLLLVAGYIATHFTALADGLEKNMASVGRWYRWRRAYHGGRGRHLDGGKNLMTMVGPDYWPLTS